MNLYFDFADLTGSVAYGVLLVDEGFEVQLFKYTKVEKDINSNNLYYTLDAMLYALKELQNLIIDKQMYKPFEVVLCNQNKIIFEWIQRERGKCGKYNEKVNEIRDKLYDLSGVVKFTANVIKSKENLLKRYFKTENLEGVPLRIKF